MKLSVKIPDGDDRRGVQQITDAGGHRHSYPVVKAKIPISILTHPFISTISTATTTPRDHLSFSLSTGFLSGPSLKFSYSPDPSSSFPFGLTLKSGLGSFGSPNDSPLIFSAHFPLSPSNPSVPIFSLHFKPQIGHFCFRKSTFSNPYLGDQSRKLKPTPGSEPVVNGRFVKTEVPNAKAQPIDLDCKSPAPLLNDGISTEGSLTMWEELKLEPLEKAAKASILSLKSGKNGGTILPGVSFKARTVVPITKRYGVKFRWGVNLPVNAGAMMPYLTVQKIEIERAAEAEGNSGSKVGDSELVKGMCFWMKKDLEMIQKENREMKQWLEDMRSGAGMQSSLGKGVSLQLNNTRGDLGVLRSKKNDRGENWRGLNLSRN